MLTEFAHNAIRAFMLGAFNHAKYKAGSTWHQATITKIEAMPDGRFGASFLIDPTSPQEISVTEVQLCDADGTVWINSPVYIMRRNTSEGILYRFAFRITAS